MLDRLLVHSTKGKDFPKNLRFLCRSHTTISNVCRAMDINRQQFNKYLAGSSHPSSSNLQKIANFFGLTVDQLFWSYEELYLIQHGADAGQNRLGAVSTGPSEVQLFLNKMRDLAYTNHDILKRYEGYYFRYNHTFDSSGRVVRSLFRVRKYQNIFFTYLIERIQHRSNKAGKLTTLKYKGVLMALSGCLFNIEYESLMKSCVGHAAFSPMPRPGQRYIQGIQSSFSSTTGRPAASRVVLEPIVQPVRMRSLLYACGTFQKDDASIDPHVMALIGNAISEPTRDLYSA